MNVTLTHVATALLACEALLALWAFRRVAASARAARGVERRMAEIEGRASVLAERADALASGNALAFGDAALPGPLGELERSLVKVSRHVAEREAVLRAEAARQQLDAQVQRAVGMAETEDATLDIASRAFGLAAPGCAAELLLSDETQVELHLAAVASAGAPGCPVSSPEGCPAMRTGQAQVFPDGQAIDACPNLRRRRGGACAAVCIPLSTTGSAMGVVHATTEGRFGEEDVARLGIVASHVGSRLRMLHVLSVFQNQAATDALTGLPNRRTFEEQTGRLLRAGRPFALGVADLDHFKKLNDTYGHPAGDEALRLFGQAASVFAVQRGGFVARFGGEEFVVVVPLEGDDPPAQPFDELRAALRGALSGTTCPRFTVSIGISIFPLHGASLKALLSTADRALYEAKARGRDGVIVAGVQVSASIPPPMGPRALTGPRSLPPPPAEDPCDEDLLAEPDSMRGAA